MFSAQNTIADAAPGRRIRGRAHVGVHQCMLPSWCLQNGSALKLAMLVVGIFGVIPAGSGDTKQISPASAKVAVTSLAKLLSFRRLE